MMAEKTREERGEIDRVVPTGSLLLGGLNLKDVFTLADALARTKMVPEAVQGKRDDIVATILRGHELGLGPMSALESIYVVHGRTDMKAAAMLALIRKSPYCRGVEWIRDGTDGTAELEYQRTDMKAPRRWKFTKAQAVAGQVQNLTKWPDAMLRARCISGMARAVFSDVFMGDVYASEEREEKSVNEAPTWAKPELQDQLGDYIAANNIGPGPGQQPRIGTWPPPAEAVKAALEQAHVEHMNPPPEEPDEMNDSLTGEVLGSADAALNQAEEKMKSKAEEYVDTIRTLKMEGQLKNQGAVMKWIRENVQPPPLRFEVANILKGDAA